LRGGPSLSLDERKAIKEGGGQVDRKDCGVYVRGRGMKAGRKDVC